MTLDPMFPTTGPAPDEPPRRPSKASDRGHTEVEIKLVAAEGDLPDESALETAAQGLGITLDEPGFDICKSCHC